MVERAFGSLRKEVDELLADRPAQPARQAGAKVFASDPKASVGQEAKGPYTSGPCVEMQSRPGVTKPYGALTKPGRDGTCLRGDLYGLAT